MLVRLSEEEKMQYCITLGLHLKRLRAIAGLTQDDLATLSGISKERISRIENGAFVMRWAQFICFIMIFSACTNTKEYMIASKIYSPRLVGALQMKDDQVPPDLVVPVSESLVNDFITDFKIVSSVTLGFLERKK